MKWAYLKYFYLCLPKVNAIGGEQDNSNLSTRQ